MYKNNRTNERNRDEARSNYPNWVRREINSPQSSIKPKDTTDLIRYISLEMKDQNEIYKLFSLNGKINDFCNTNASETKMNQLRKFYDDIVKIQEQSNAGKNIKFEKMVRLVPLAKYANARNLLDDDFLGLLDNAIGKISETYNREDGKNKSFEMLGRFRLVLEAIIAYSKQKSRGGD